MTQRNQIIILNVALLAASMWLGLRLVDEWRKSLNPYSAGPIVSKPYVSAFTFPSTGSVSASGSQIIARNPFSPDRNSIVAPSPVPASGPPPQLPIVIGTMKLGENYEALMAETVQSASTSSKQLKSGAVINGYKIVEIHDDEVIVELNGERSTINVYLSSSGVARSSARSGSGVESAGTQPAAPRIETSATQPMSGTSQAGSAPPSSTAVHLPSPDPWLKITVEGNRRRYERTTMFGPDIWYEDIK